MAIIPITMTIHAIFVWDENFISRITSPLVFSEDTGVVVLAAVEGTYKIFSFLNNCNYANCAIIIITIL